MKTTANSNNVFRNAARDFVTREDIACGKFLRYCAENADMSAADATAVYNLYVRNKMMKIDRIGGSFHVSHGGLLDPEALRRALKIARSGRK